MRKKTTYGVICQSVLGGGDDGFSIAYAVDSKRFDTRQAAINYGFTLDRSDDFNIGVWDGEDLISLDWMEKSVDRDPELLRKITGTGLVAA
jgi:hypothetical protein